MTTSTNADAIAPAALKGTLSRVTARLSPVEFWLFGSRARGDARVDSDWDLLAVVADDAPDAVDDPLFAWETARASDVPVTLLVTRRSELHIVSTVVATGDVQFFIFAHRLNLSLKDSDSFGPLCLNYTR